MGFIPNSPVLKKGTSFFGGKDNVQIVLDEGLRHGPRCNPFGVEEVNLRIPRVARKLATLGFGINPFGQRRDGYFWLK